MQRNLGRRHRNAVVRRNMVVTANIIGARLAPGLYQALVNASAANRSSISAEVERRLERSFKRDPAHMDDALQELGRHILASFEAGGRLENRNCRLRNG